jgi:hypothetical protein
MGPCQGPETGSTPVIRSRMFRIFSKTTTEKIANSSSGAYLYILFPIAITFLLTFFLTRVITDLFPNFFFTFGTGSHIHHYTYGIIILVITGYISLANSSPRERYLVSLLYGIGLGLVFDEFGLWFHLSDTASARLSYDGVVVLVALFIIMISAESGIHVWNRHFGKKEPQTGPVSGPKTEGLGTTPTP